MNKGMVIFDKPNRCEECPCCYISPIISGRICNITGDYISHSQTLHDNCPIISLDQEQMDTILSALQKRMKW